MAGGGRAGAGVLGVGCGEVLGGMPHADVTCVPHFHQHNTHMIAVTNPHVSTPFNTSWSCYACGAGDVKIFWPLEETPLRGVDRGSCAFMSRLCGEVGTTAATVGFRLGPRRRGNGDARVSGAGASIACHDMAQAVRSARISSPRQETSSSGSSESSDSGARSSSDSDSEGEAVRRGKRARRGTPSKARQPAPAAAAGGSLTVNRDGTVASASAAELRIAAELAKDPWGR